MATKTNADNLYFRRIDKRILKISQKLVQILGLLEHSAISRSLMEKGVTWHARKSPSTIYATARATLRLCPFLPPAPLPDFQDIRCDKRDSILRYIEDKLFKISVHAGTDFQSFVYRALAHGTTEPDNWDLLDEHPIPEHCCKDVYSFLIAAVCRYQVAVSQSYTNFPSIDQLRQILLDRAGRRPYKGTAWTSCRTAIGSWEDGVSELRVLPSDEEIEANYNAYAAKHVKESR